MRSVSGKGLQFIGPAGIDKFLIQGGELTNVGTFSNPTGYRFTTHRVFDYNGKSYLCTIGHPNRLVFVDTETMEMLFYQHK